MAAKKAGLPFAEDLNHEKQPGGGVLSGDGNVVCVIVVQKSK